MDCLKLESVLCSESRTSFSPIKFQDIYAAFVQAKTCLWTFDEVDLTQDVKQWNTLLTPEEKKGLTSVLAFFAVGDGIVNGNLLSNIMNQIKNIECQLFYGVQFHIENEHALMYAALVEAFIIDPTERERVLACIKTMPTVGRKVDWIKKYANATDISLGENITAFAIVEGLFFSASFALIFWFKSRNLLPGLCQSNEFIARDEGLHCKFACLLLNKYLLRPNDEKIIMMVREAVDIEKKFFEEELPPLLGMNSSLMSLYIEFMADWLLQELGIDAIFNAANPFENMNMLAAPCRTNSFEKRTTDYQVAVNSSEAGMIDEDDLNF